MEVLALIPARGGSKGIPRKNLAHLLGRPLLTYTCEAALQSRLLNRTIVSTDDPEIAAIAASAGIEVPFLRPAPIAADSSEMISVIEHALEYLRPYRPDAVVLLQPTSPLRRAEHIDEAIRLLEKTKADTVVSVLKVPHQFTPGSVLRMSDGLLAPYEQGETVLRRQDKPTLYARNGPAVLAIRTASLAAGRLYGDRVAGFEMTSADSVDIDGPEDLALAEFYLSRRLL